MNDHSNLNRDVYLGVYDYLREFGFGDGVVQDAISAWLDDNKADVLDAIARHLA
jgi:hypothetical protein